MIAIPEVERTWLPLSAALTALRTERGDGFQAALSEAAAREAAVRSSVQTRNVEASAFESFMRYPAALQVR